MPTRRSSSVSARVAAWSFTLENKRTGDPPREEMATDVNVIADYGVHKTTRKDTLEPSDTGAPLAIFSRARRDRARANSDWRARKRRSSPAGRGEKKKVRAGQSCARAKPERARGDNVFRPYMRGMYVVCVCVCVRVGCVFLVLTYVVRGVIMFRLASGNARALGGKREVRILRKTWEIASRTLFPRTRFRAIRHGGMDARKAHICECRRNIVAIEETG